MLIKGQRGIVGLSSLKFPRHFFPKTQKYDFITIGYVA